jgi:preprotein translocase subunit SecA
MIGNIFKSLTKIFGSKSDRDLKELYPIVEEIKIEYEKLSGLSDDQLRAKTAEFKKIIADGLSNIDQSISELRAQTQEDGLDLNVKDGLFKQIDKLEKERNEELEKILNDILPQAFAVVKETARRLSENKQLVVTATEWDKTLSLKNQLPLKVIKPFGEIAGMLREL